MASGLSSIMFRERDFWPERWCKKRFGLISRACQRIPWPHGSRRAALPRSLPEGPRPHPCVTASPLSLEERRKPRLEG
jgi:hypothetical protein